VTTGLWKDDGIGIS